MTRPFSGLSQNALKLIALVCMTVDHIGHLLLPQLEILRIIGRIAYPIFAYAIYEGCKYTRRPVLYLGRMAALGLLCLLVYYRYSGTVYGSIFITFSFSIGILLGLRLLRERRFFAGAAVTLCAAALASFVCSRIEVDYGLGGVLLPACAMLFDFLPQRERPAGRSVRLPLLGFGLGLAVYCLMLRETRQYFCLLALPLLALANGSRGRWRLKYLFYVYYPAHLVVLQLIHVLIYR